MSDKPQKMNLNSMDISEEKRKKLKSFFQKYSMKNILTLISLKEF